MNPTGTSSDGVNRKPEESHPRKQDGDRRYKSHPVAALETIQLYAGTRQLQAELHVNPRLAN
jgi:hypothetical protein